MMSHEAGDVVRALHTDHALRESEERYRAVVESAGEVISTIDENGVFLFMNSMAAERLEGSPVDFEGKTMHQLFPPEVADRQLASIRQVLADGHRMEFHSQTVVRGEPREYHTSITPLRRSPVRAVLLVARDVTEKRKAERELRELNAELARRAGLLRSLAGQLTEADQARRSEASQVLHDGVQQSLAAAKLRLGMLRRSGGDAEALIDQIDGLLTESIETVRSLARELSPPILRSGSFAGALGWLGRQMRHNHGLQVRVDSEKATGPLGMEKRVFLFTAVRELLYNVSKHAVSTEAAVRCLTADGCVRITVSDEGVGFDPSALRRGGFGLFTIRERTEALGGGLEIRSAPGEGTQISLWIPEDPADQEIAPH